MLHLLEFAYDSTDNKIYTQGFDEESRTFANEFQEDHPNGYILGPHESALEAVLEFLHGLEGAHSQYHEVVSVSETTRPNRKMRTQRETVWMVWYRNKD